MKMNDMFPSKYLKADDLKGRTFTLVIANCAMEMLGQGQNQDQRLVVYFQGAQKGMVCNKTNAERISYLYGDDTDMWVGKEITLYSELVNFQGKMGPAIRVRPPEPRGTAAAPGPAPKPVMPAAADDLSDSIPF